MKFSIVTPSLNYGRYLREAIDSVAAQGRADTEHLVFDGGSTDGTLDVLRACAGMPHLRWTSARDRGQSDAINKGFRAATGDVVAWLNADEYYAPGAFDAVERAFAADPSADVVYGETLFVDGAGRRIRIKREHPFDRGVFFHRPCHIVSASTFMRASIVRAGHFLDEGLRIAMDFEYFARLANQGFRFLFIPNVLAAFRIHGANASLTQDSLRRSELLAVLFRHAPRRFADDRVQRIWFELLGEAFRVKRWGLKLRRMAGHPMRGWGGNAPREAACPRG